MIVVVGGAGFVGRHLVPRLAGRGERVRVTCRSRASLAQLKRDGVEPVVVDIRQPVSLRAAIEGARVVVNLVTATMERRRGDFAAVHAGGMANLVDVAREVGVDRVLHVGALADIDPPADSGFDYLYWKQRGTELLRQSGLRFTVFETSIVFGIGDQQMSAIAFLLKRLPFFPMPDAASAKTRFQPIWVEDLVECLARAAYDDGSACRTFPLGGPEVFAYSELVDEANRFLNTRRRTVYISRPAARAALSVGMRLMRHPPLTPAMVDLAGVNSVALSSSTYSYFGLEPARLSTRLQYLRDVSERDLWCWFSGRRRGLDLGRSHA